MDHRKFFLAAKEGDVDHIRTVLEGGADVNMTWTQKSFLGVLDGDTLLHVACRRGDVEIAELLIKNRADLLVTNRAGNTPLHVACSEGHDRVVKLLVENQADLQTRNQYGGTPLDVASRLGHVKIAELLIKNQEKNEDRGTPLHYACERGHCGVVEVLLKNQPGLLARHDKDGNSPLHAACKSGQSKVVVLLLKHQADLLATNRNGESPLHMACRRGHYKVVKLLIENQADLMLPNKNGDTPLHEACRGGDDRIVELFIRNRVDLLKRNKENKRPIDVVEGWDTFRRLYLEVATVKQEEYSELVSSLGAEMETTVKLFLCGHGQVGKTSLKTILEKAGLLEGIIWNIRTKFRKEDTYNPTPGVSVSSKMVRRIGRLSLHDFAGQAQFYVTHAMLLRTTNAIFPLVYKITDTQEEQERQVHGWLSFINCSNADPTNKPRIVLIASHADKLRDREAGHRRATAMVEHYRELFKETLVVSQEVFLMNCMEARTSEIKRLREVLATLRNEVLKERQYVPKVCVQLMDTIEGWRKDKKAFPVIEWREYLQAVRQAISSLQEGIVQLASSYLHDQGEIIYLRKGDSSLIVLDPQWLCSFVFGPLLAPDDFPIDKIQRTAEDYVTRQELIRIFSVVADIPLLIKLLQYFQLCHTYNGQAFIFPSLLQQEIGEGAWSSVSSKAIYFGTQICCRSETDCFSCDMFPRLQTMLMQEHPSKLSRPLLWKNSAKITDGKADALVQMSQDKRQLNIFVRSIEGNRQDCKSIMDFLTLLVYNLLHETSPGTRSRNLVLSSLDLREHRTHIHAYSRVEVETAAEKGENLVHPQRSVPEKVKDLLVHLGNRKGMLGRVARKRPELVETLRHLDPILNQLLEDDVINMEEYGRIKVLKGTRTHQDITGELIDILETKGERACIGFHSVLEKADPYAASLLEENQTPASVATAN